MTMLHGVPNWRTFDGYPAIDAGATVWAWEFLRRSPAYRAFWKEKIEPFQEIVKSLPSGEEVTVIGCNADGVSWPYLDEMRSVFGVEVPSPPHESRPPYFCASFIRTVEYNPRRQRDGAQSVCLAENEMAIVFDLSRPLKAQFEFARAVAKERQQSIAIQTARKRPEFYVTYLRILDGLDSGENLRQVADVLFDDLPTTYPENPRLSACQDARDAAVRMRDVGYSGLIETGGK